MYVELVLLAKASYAQFWDEPIIVDGALGPSAQRMVECHRPHVAVMRNSSVNARRSLKEKWNLSASHVSGALSTNACQKR